MAYAIGIDLGTTYTAAAVADDDGRVEMLALEHANSIVPSVIAIPAGHEPIIGTSAQRRGLTDPTAIAREFKRRFGDTTPLLLDGQPHASQQLMALLARWVIDRATAENGQPPAAVAITHPANWGPYKRELLADVGRLAGRPDTLYLPEPTAAATWYARQARLDVGDLVAVYDFGGGTFDAVVLRRLPDGFEVVGQPTGVERLGGIDLDEQVVQFALQASGLDLGRLDPTDPAQVSAMARLRSDAREAKEALSSDTSTNLVVDVGQVHHQVRLTRTEFEDLIRPAIRDTVSSLRQAIDSSGLALEEITTVLLVGGSSRIPLVGEIVTSETGRPITADAHSKNAVALGAAMTALSSLSPARGAAPPGPDATPESEPAPVHEPDTTARLEPKAPAGAEPVEPPHPLELTERPSSRDSLVKIAAGGAAVVLALLAAVFLFGRNGGDTTPSADSDAAPTTADAEDEAEPDDAAATTGADAAEGADAGTSDGPGADDEADAEQVDPVVATAGRTDSWVGGERADPARTGDWGSAGPTSAPAEVWRSADAVGGHPVALDGVLYASFEDQTLRAVDLETGSDIWSRETSFGFRTPTLTEDAVFYVDGFDVVATDRATGSAELFRLTPGSDDDASSPESPTVVDGRLYAMYSRLDGEIWTNTLVVVDLDSGEMVWQWSRESPRSALPVIVTDELVILVLEHEVWTLERETGGERWSLTLPGDISPTTALVSDGALVIHDTRLRALELADGEERWSTPDSALQYGATDGLVFTHSLDTRALDSSDGSLIWSTGWDGPPVSGPIVIGDGAVYSHGSSGGALDALDLASGERLWSLVDEEAFEPGLPLVTHSGYLVAVDGQQRIVVYG